MPDRRTLLARLLALGAGAMLPAGAGTRAADNPNVLLIASERMGDPRFRDTVLLVMRHGPGGPLGVILNRPTHVRRGDALRGWPGLPAPEQPVFFGGPVAPRTLYYAARLPVEPPEVLTVAQGVYIGLNLQRLAALLDAGITPEALRIYAGYAGWAPGQLERELDRGDWHLQPLSVAPIFDEDPETLYRRMSERARLLPA